MPERIQRRRVKGWRLPRNGVCCNRPGIWGNPYRVIRSGDRRAVVHETAKGVTRTLLYGTHAECAAYAVRRFEEDLRAGRLGVTVDQVRALLRGCDLACFCPLPAPGEPDVCHAAVLLRIANEGTS